MDLMAIIKNLHHKVSEGAYKSTYEDRKWDVKCYWAGIIIRIDIKDKTNNKEVEHGNPER